MMSEDEDQSPVKERNLDGEIANAALHRERDEIIRRFGSAAREHYAAYTGKNTPPDPKKTDTLKQLNRHKGGLAQRGGYAAEIKAVARRNANHIETGDDIRFAREGHNDEIVDLMQIDNQGRPLPGSESQMKFIGATPEELLAKLQGRRCQKYIDASVYLDIADDDYAALMGHNGTPGLIDQRLDELNDLLENASTNKKAEIQGKIDKLRTIKSKLRKSGLTRGEAVEAVLHPKWATVKDVIGVAHKAGVQQALNVAAVTGAMSLVREFVAYVKGEEDLQEAAGKVGKTVGIAAAMGYVTAFAGSAVKGAMQNSASEYVRYVSQTNVVSGMASAGVEVGKSVVRLCQGKITPAQCVEELGEKGVGQIGSLMGAAAAAAAASGAGMGTMATMALSVAGSTVGYSAALAVYRELSMALEEYELAREDRIRMEKECAEAIEAIRRYRVEMDTLAKQYFERCYTSFEAGFAAMDQAIINQDPDGYIAGNAEICEVLGRKPQFRSMSEFNDLMASDESLKL